MRISSALAAVAGSIMLAACGGQAVERQVAPTLEVVFPPAGANFAYGLSLQELNHAQYENPDDPLFTEGEWQTTVVVRIPADAEPQVASVNGVRLQRHSLEPSLWLAQVPIRSGTNSLSVAAVFADGTQSNAQVQLRNSDVGGRVAAKSVLFDPTSGFLYAGGHSGVYRQQVDINLVEALAEISCFAECPLALAGDALYTTTLPPQDSFRREWIVQLGHASSDPVFLGGSESLYLDAPSGLAYDRFNHELWIAEYDATGLGSDSLYRFDTTTGAGTLAEIRVSDDATDRLASIIGANDLVMAPDGKTLFVWSSRISQINVIALEGDYPKLIGTIGVEAIRRSSADAHSAFAVDFSRKRIYFTNRDLEALVRADFAPVLDALPAWRAASEPQQMELVQRDTSFSVRPGETNGVTMPMDMDGRLEKYNTSITLNEDDQIAYIAGSGYLVAVSLLTGDRVAIEL